MDLQPNNAVIQLIEALGYTEQDEEQHVFVGDNFDMLKEGIKPWHKEGFETLEWVLIDFVNIVAQIFSRKSREYYDFERLWGDAKIIKMDDQ